MNQEVERTLGPMAVQAREWGIDPVNGRLVMVVCLVLTALIVLPFLWAGPIGSVIVSLVVVSFAALLGSTTTAVLYLCLLSAIVPTQVFEDHLLLPMDFKFYEGLFLLVIGVAAAAWLQTGRLGWHRTRLDRPILVFLILLVASVGIGFYYGQSTSRMLRDVRYPFYYALFFVVTGFFDVRRHRAFLYVVLGSSAVVGLEYLAEFLGVVNLSISGVFVRVARIEGLMLAIGVLLAAAAFVYDRGPARKALVGLAMVPAALALMLTVGRGLWISVAVGLCILAGLVVLDRRTMQRRSRRMLILLLLPLVVVGVGYLFQQITRTGLAETAMRRVTRAMDYEEDYALAARMVSYGFTVEKIRRRPVLGGGHGATVSYIQTDEAVPYIFTTGTVDNVYLTLMLRMGIVGLAAFLWIFLRAGRTAYRLFQRSGDPTVRLFCVAFLTVYGAMLVYGMADATMMSNRLIFIHATFLGILARLDGESEDGAPA